MVLPKYTTKEYIIFLKDMRKQKRRVFHYSGDCFWSGPAVKINNLTELFDIHDGCRVATHYETTSDGYVVHPYIRGE